MAEFGGFEEGAELAGRMADGSIAEAEIESMMESVRGEFEKLGLNPEEIDISEGQIMYKGKVVDFEKINEKLRDPNLDKAGKPIGGNLLDALKEMGVDDAVLDSPEVRSFAERFQEGFENSPVTNIRRRFNELTKDSASTESGVPKDPETAEELKKQIEDNKELKEQLQKAQDELKERAKQAQAEGKDAIEAGSDNSWKKTLVKVAAILAAGGLGAVMLFKWIKHHQKEVNGCWLIFDDGSKCKVSMLTCDSQSRQEGKLCTSSQTVCKDHKNCFTTQTCTQYGEDGKTCSQYLTQCTDGRCSQYCDCTKIDCPKGSYLTCVNLNFWQSAADFFGEPLRWTSGIIASIGKVLKMVIIGLIVAVGITIVIVLIVKLIHVAKGKGKNKEVIIERGK